MKIGIINYGMGNLASVKNALDYLSISSEIFDDPLKINQFDKLILPGVGAFGQAMNNLKSSRFDEAIKEAVLAKNIPILGICLGMQLLLSDSTEHGNHIGLNLIEGNVLNFNEIIDDLPVPHIGWNEVSLKHSTLSTSVENEKPSYYFVHSFYCQLHEEQYVTGTTEYGTTFHSMFEKENIAGCQFHPEKSQKYGLAIFTNFAENTYA